ncbi:MAG: tRNA epoxyqueuosine(34) reductase QueG [Candidatus Omnitrophica bacterium]|nr:tRNA epoxyqueuosine(34) reductase QueG [Candidatus Omnitrophota bacterium]
MLNHKVKIAEFARKECGFDDCRITDPFVEDPVQRYREWIENNYHGDMTYLANHLPFKANPEHLLEGVKSAIVVIKNYKNTTETKLTQKFKIARYAVGKDYHQVMKEHLEKLAEYINKLDSSAETYCAIDSRPVAERGLALNSGIGFLGKNTMVIKPGIGSYFFIGVVLTTLELPFDESMMWDCGQCRLCLDTCPTNALLDNYQMDAKNCISYMTIEQKEVLSDEQLENTQGWMFGCDLCQEVCPYNSSPKIPLTDWKEFLPTEGVGFNFLDTIPEEKDIPKNTPLYRSRKRLIPNVIKAHSRIKG